jgi:hypothetical protein
MIGEDFPVPEDWIGIDEIFIVKYTPTTQSSLAIHQDGDDFSFVIMLNDAFEGGGTSFPFVSSSQNASDSTEESIAEHINNTESVSVLSPSSDYLIYNQSNMQIGDMLLFNGRNPHAGNAIVSGERYILTGFLSIGETKYCNTHF